MEKYSNQIYRLDGKNCFMEVLNSAFKIGKLQMNFVSYDENTKKQKCKLDIYMNMDEALALANIILSGRLERKIATAQQTGKFEGKDVNDYTSYYTDMGGTTFNGNTSKYDKAKKEFAWLTDSNCCISKQFKVQASTKYKFMFRAEYALGAKNETGLIVPTGKPQAYVQIPISEMNAISFAMVIQSHIQAYYNFFYNNFGKNLFPGVECNIYSPSDSKTPSPEKKPENNMRETNAQEETNCKNQPVSKEEDSKPVPEDEEKMICLSTSSKLLPMPRNSNEYAVKGTTIDGKEICLVFKEPTIATCNRWSELKESLMNKEKIKLTIKGKFGNGNVVYFVGLAM